MSQQQAASHIRPEPVPLAPATGRSHAAHLPAPLSSLIGRDGEVAAIGTLVRDPAVRLVTLVGPGGVGKTRLALAVAASLAADFSDGAYFVALGPVTDPALVLQAVAHALGIRNTGNRPIAEHLVLALGTAHHLLVIDNFEQVLDAAPAVASLLVACPGLTALVTSRERLRLSGEHVYEVQPLPICGGIGSPRDDETDAVALFAQRAREAYPGFVLIDRDRPHVRDICARLDGLPLAIELAAGRVAMLPPPALLARLERRLPLLVGGARDQPARQRTLRDTIAWSYDLLSPEEQALFRTLAIFAGGFTLEAAGGVSQETARGQDGKTARDSYDARLTTLELVSSLVSRSLLRVEQRPDGAVRFHMLETIREYAGDLLDAAGETDVVRRAHAAWSLRYAERSRHGQFPADDQDVLDGVTVEFANLRAALVWLESTGQFAEATRLVVAMSWYWYVRGDRREGATWLEWATACEAETSPQLRTDMFVVLGLIVITLGDARRAESYAASGLECARQIDDPLFAARALVVLGAAASGQGAHGRARGYLEEAVGLARSAGDSPDAIALASAALDNLGVAVHGQGDLTLAATLNRDVLEGYTASGSLRGRMVALSDRGDIARDQGDVPLALASFQEGLALAWEYGENRLVGEALDGIAEVAGAHGETVLAARLFGAADRLRERAGIGMWLDFNRDAHRRGVERVRTALGVEAFDAAWGAGRAGALAEAVGDAVALSLTTDPAQQTGVRNSGVAFAALTPRETTVLRLLVAGLTDAEIAASLFIGVRTAEHHVGNILGKIGVRTRTAAVTAAIAAGLARTDDAAAS